MAIRAKRGLILKEIIGNFVNIGDNCEFGFVQNAFESYESSLFRWALTHSFDTVSAAIEARFVDLFKHENLIPCSATMVRDTKYAIEFHTKMPIEAVDGGWKFATTPDERDGIYQSEAKKFHYMANKFLATLAATPRIYVAKKRESPGLAPAERLLAELRKHGDASILYVTEATPENPAGSVRRASKHLYVGYIDRFSWYLTIEDISVDVWAEIVGNTWRLHNRRTLLNSARIAALKFFGPRTEAKPPKVVPAGFDRVAYLEANPDVASAGMDAAEHYLKYGWKENRPLHP